ncbi:hypothetical protein Q5752_001267 [Cryptotrichosporon argae]
MLPLDKTHYGPMRPLRGCSALVIRCFRRVEAFADAVTGAAGPVFVALCWVLIGSGGLVFFDVVARSLPPWLTLPLLPVYALVPLNMYGHYYLVTTVSPGFPSPRTARDTAAPLGPSSERWGAPGPAWARPERWGFAARRRLTDWGEPRRVRRCRKCEGPKPERSHHCSVCKRCVLLMDHHCPWINGCVGLHNQRHFVLFMLWLSAGCFAVATLGYPHFWASIDTRESWPAYSPRLAFTLIYVLCLAIGIAVFTLCTWHLVMVSNGETSIESHDNVYLENKAKAEGMIYLNPYDLGRRRNLELFFNVGPGGYSYRTLLVPLAVPAYTAGWSYARRALPVEPALKPTTSLHTPELADGLVYDHAHSHAHGHGHVHEDDMQHDHGRGYGRAEAGAGAGASRYVMGDEEGLTDDEEGGGGWWE